ncbi:uroporphyrinogen decarboxylase [Christiangramia salexigens]|uniref:Uroporphyrinogen decarboxylase n=1 Tax=Christiangramia salexigens TaxID=1913577 RepID=A0A1L3J897_9FLAO|nr:uroporphyrinogen decarboxylase [Christiangramia salexigens]APG58894.1 uroporphyrinogen decarboxylase [Christiangramia salexigens]APG61324.1 uroporphyrinogen decarboxylase [Christiangramia salexigens]
MTEFLGISVTEWIGYLASFFVLLSFLMRNIVTLRYVNSVGCIFFVVYGFLLDSWPIIITNLAIVSVNFFYLFINKRKPETAA